MPPSPHDPENLPDTDPLPSQSKGPVHDDQTEIVASGSGSVLANPVTDRPPPPPMTGGDSMESGFASAPDLATSAPGIDSLAGQAGPSGSGAGSRPGGYGSALGQSWGESEGLPIGHIEPGLTLFGKYEIVRMLGRGGMGSVWLVRHLGLHSERALKVVNADLNVHSGAAKRFEREARAMAAFTHPNAVMVHDARPARDGAYIEMEYVEGKTLQKVMSSGQPMPLPWILRILDQLCDVLEVAHKKGIIHRDLKPANLMLLDGRAPGKEHLKVLDFGIAKILEESADLGSMTNGFLGTPAYVSPEQALAEPIDGRADLYTVGVMLFEFLTGSRPFGGNPTQLVMQHVNTPPPSLSEVNPKVQAGESVELFLQRCLAKDPRDRPHSARALFDGFCLALADSPLKSQAGALLDALPPSPTPSSFGGSRIDTPFAPTDPLPGFSGVLPHDNHYTPPEVPRPNATEEATLRKDPTGNAVPTELGVLTDVDSTAGLLGRIGGSAAFGRGEATHSDPIAIAEPVVAPPTRPRWLIPAIAGGVVALLAGISFVATRGGSNSSGTGPTPPGGSSGTVVSNSGTGKDDPTTPKNDRPLILPPGWAWPEDASLKTGGKVVIERSSDRVRYAQLDSGAFLPIGYKPVTSAGSEGKWPKVIAREADGVEFVYIESGRFEMGNPDAEDGSPEKPAHPVVVSSFYLQRHEVTNAEVEAYLKAFKLQTAWPKWRKEFDRCIAENKRPAADSYPATGVTYRQATDFARSTGISGQLPTEAQWEFAARNRGRNKLYPWGTEPPDRTLANIEMDGSTTTEPVGKYPRDQTAQGAFDMIGNVGEWCRDVWKAYLPSDKELIDPPVSPGSDPKALYAIRGGSFKSFQEDCRATFRSDKYPDTQSSPAIGFRVVIEIPRDLPEIRK